MAAKKKRKKLPKITQSSVVNRAVNIEMPKMEKSKAVLIA